MLETLKFGEGNWANKTDSTLAYSDQYGNYKPLPFDFTRASSATRVNKQGLIESVNEGIARIDYSDSTQGALLLEPQRTNLITQSEAFGNTYWTKNGATIQGDPSTAGSELVVNGDFATDLSGWNTLGSVSWDSGSAKFNGGTQDIYQEVLTQHKMYEITYDWTRTSGILEFYAGNLNQANVVSSGSSGTETFMAAAYANVGVPIPKAEFYSTNFIGTIDNVSIKEVQGFTSPSADSPLNAFKFVEDSANTYHYCRVLNTAVSSGATVTLSMFSKKAENNYIALFEGKTAGTVFFNLNNGTIVSESGGATGTIELLPNNWCKISLTVTVPSTAANFEIYTSNDGTSLTYQGVNGNGTYIYGAQLEQSSYPTSYIPTQGSTVTRVAETCYGAGNASTFNDSEGVLMAEINFSYIELGRYITISDGTSSNRVIIGTESSPNLIRVYVIVGGNVQCNISYTLTDITIFHKILIKYKLNDFALWIDGFEVGTDTSGSAFPLNTLNQLVFDSGAGTSNFYGKTKQIQYFNTALTDQELAALTTI